MTTKPPFLSIVTVTKNNVRGLMATWNSIRTQSTNDYEWIIVDGASTDETLDFLKQENLLPLCVSEPDKGIYDAMNKGIARAQGNYILFLNAGDQLADMDMIATLAKAASDTPDFIYGDALETGGFYKKARNHKKIVWGMFTHHQAMLYRREKIKSLRYDDNLKISADYGFTAAFLQNANTCHYIPAAICIFEEGGISQRQRTEGRREQFLIRRHTELCSPAWNIIVYAAQTVSALLREKSPRLYFKLRTIPLQFRLGMVHHGFTKRIQ